MLHFVVGACICLAPAVAPSNRPPLCKLPQHFACISSCRSAGRITYLLLFELITARFHGCSQVRCCKLFAGEVSESGEAQLGAAACCVSLGIAALDVGQIARPDVVSPANARYSFGLVQQTTWMINAFVRRRL
jgi:hypothetical protein